MGLTHIQTEKHIIGYILTSLKNTSMIIIPSLMYIFIITMNKNFFNEFVLEVNNADEFLSKLKSNNILGGLKLDDNKILVCATEMNTEEEIEEYVKLV